MVYDIAIIGAGVVGAMTARELSKYKLNICLIDKEYDVATATTAANSGIIHAGYDALPGTLKAKMNVLGSKMMKKVVKDLDVDYKETGSLVLAFNEEDKKALETLMDYGKQNGVEKLQILNAEETFKLEPNLSTDVIASLYAPTAGIICPYGLAIAAAENAVTNGVDIKLNFEVKEIDKKENDFRISSDDAVIQSKIVINAAGTYADYISSITGDDSFDISPRKGEYYIIDKTEKNLVQTVIFQTPTTKGKGILVCPTVDGNILIGPNSTNMSDKDENTTTDVGLDEVYCGAKKSVPKINRRKSINMFAGIRATPNTKDFIIEESKKVKNLINLAGIESPGLSASPAIALEAVKLVEGCGIELIEKENYVAKRKGIVKINEMSIEDRNKKIFENSKYGNIICRCEEISEGEIVDSINRPVGATTVTGVKRRARAGMGRCQGGFCLPKVMDIIKREKEKPLESITKFGGESYILTGPTRKGKKS